MLPEKTFDCREVGNATSAARLGYFDAGSRSRYLDGPPDPFTACDARGICTVEYVSTASGIHDLNLERREVSYLATTLRIPATELTCSHHATRPIGASQRLYRSNRFALGVLYAELLAPEEGRRQLIGALTLARELRSQFWIHYVAGALAVACCLLDDLTGAQTCLETVLSPQTPMDTMGKRYCWARWAELALSQGDAALALAITDRLIASAAGMAPGRVITFLWKLKGEALAAMGRMEEACSLLRAAKENARVMEERFLLWRVHASLARLYRATSRQIEARREFSSARELIEGLAATVPDKALKDNFLQGAYSTLDARQGRGHQFLIAWIPDRTRSCARMAGSLTQPVLVGRFTAPPTIAIGTKVQLTTTGGATQWPK